MALVRMLFAVVLVLWVIEAKAGIPQGATGLCNDGTYTNSKTEEGACSAHGGVKAWFSSSDQNSLPVSTTGRVADQAKLAQEPGSMNGNWEITEKTNALDNSHNYVAAINADNTVANIIGASERPRLMISCDRNGFIVDLHWPDWIDKDIDDTSVVVQWKLNDGGIQSANWDAIDQAVALTGEVGKAWMNTIANGQKLIIRVPDRHGGQDAIFTLDGLDKVAEAINTRNCGS